MFYFLYNKNIFNKVGVGVGAIFSANTQPSVRLVEIHAREKYYYELESSR